MTNYPGGGSGWLLDHTQYLRDWWDRYLTQRDSAPPREQVSTARDASPSGRSGS